MVIIVLLSAALALGFFLKLYEVDWMRGYLNIYTFLKDIRLEGEVLYDALYAIYETLLISLFATALAIAISLPLAAVSITDVVPRWAAVIARSTAAFARSIPALMWGVLGVVAFGPGPAAGAVALTIYSVGYLTKLFYETFENVDRNFVDAVKVVGARGLKLAVLIYRQQKRQIVTNSIFMLEYNVRTATIIGFVGAGGVGYYITQYLNLLDYGAAATFIVAVFFIVLAMEGASYVLRRRSI
ncbi:MAG: ABC transporter permease subunit [Pyrobaculum sp.]